VEGCDINQKDRMGDTPLAWAARKGHERVVKALLGRSDIDPDKSGEGGRTPLMLAAWAGHERVVKILLAREGVDPDKADRYGRTPLWWATYNEHEGVVQLLRQPRQVRPGTTLVGYPERGQGGKTNYSGRRRQPVKRRKLS